MGPHTLMLTNPWGFVTVQDFSDAYPALTGFSSPSYRVELSFPFVTTARAIHLSGLLSRATCSAASFRDWYLPFPVLGLLRPQWAGFLNGISLLLPAGGRKLHYNLIAHSLFLRVSFLVCQRVLLKKVPIFKKIFSFRLSIPGKW